MCGRADDYFGFEGLAYVYFIKGDYERSEWFINAALELAKTQAETGDLDQKYYETLVQNGRTIKERGLLELHQGTFTPGEACNLFVTDRKTWYKNVFAASVQRRYEMLMVVISQPLPFAVDSEEIEEESDVEHYDNPGYVVQKAPVNTKKFTLTNV